MLNDNDWLAAMDAMTEKSKRRTKDSVSGVWNTEHGRRRVRHEPPTLEEAVAAASGLTEDPQQQADIAAGLMGLPVDQVRTAVVRANARRRQQVGIVGTTSRSGGARAVVVERKTVRRPGVRRFDV